jgi:hypothetical protein
MHGSVGIILESRIHIEIHINIFGSRIRISIKVNQNVGALETQRGTVQGRGRTQWRRGV